MNERSIQILLMQEFLAGRNHVACVPNSTLLLHGEVDLLSVTKAGLVHEFEIKCTRSDYNRDFKTKNSKHRSFATTPVHHLYVPNYYWFVTLEFEIEPPSYAGWICVKDVEDNGWYHAGVTHYLSEIKKAPRLHSHSWDDKQVARIARLLSFRLLKEYRDGSTQSI